MTGTGTNTERIHSSRDFLLSDILIFVKIIKEMILCVALWNTCAEGTCVYEEGGSWMITATGFELSMTHKREKHSIAPRLKICVDAQSDSGRINEGKIAP